MPNASHHVASEAKGMRSDVSPHSASREPESTTPESDSSQATTGSIGRVSCNVMIGRLQVSRVK